MPSTEPDLPRDPWLVDAIVACRTALADYEAGLLSDAELRRTLFRTGLVCRDDEAWLLDLETGSWHRYDGITVHGAGSSVRRADVQRWRRSLAELSSDERDRRASW